MPRFNIEKFKMKKNQLSEKIINLKIQINKNENKKVPNLFTSDVLWVLCHKLSSKKQLIL